MKVICWKDIKKVLWVIWFLSLSIIKKVSQIIREMSNKNYTFFSNKRFFCVFVISCFKVISRSFLSTRTTVADNRKFTVIYRSRIARQQSLSFIHRSLNFPQEIRIRAFQNSNKCLSDPDSLVYITRRSSLNVQVYSKVTKWWPWALWQKLFALLFNLLAVCRRFHWKHQSF